MKSPKDMKIIQIEITNACVHQCSNCTRFCGHHKKPFFMDYGTFTQAVDSMDGFRGIVGIMGGEPTIHPEFARFADYFRTHFDSGNSPKSLRAPTRDFMGYVLSNLFDDFGCNRRGLWSSIGKKYYEHFERIQDTFGYQAINDHANPSMHETLMVTRHELGIPDEEWFELRDACWIQNIWSASITPKGAFFCEIAAALDILFDGPGGWPIEPGWWKRKPADFADQLHWCELCSAPLAMPKRDAREGIDDVSPAWYEKLRQIDSPKLRKGHVHRFDVSGYRSADHEVIHESLPYLHDQTLRISESNRAVYPQQVQAVLLLPSGMDSALAERLVRETQRHVEVIAVVSDGDPLLSRAWGDAVPSYDRSRIPGSEILDSIRRAAQDWLVLLRGVPASPTLVTCLSSAVHNPGCLYLGPILNDPSLPQEPSFAFFNTRAIALRNGADIGNLAACYPADKIVRTKIDQNRKVKIYLACHNDTVRIENGILTPIQVGKARADVDLEMLGDDTGDNISEDNPAFAELTAQYWAWKNDRESDHAGCMHYRRVFAFNEGHEQEVTFQKDRILSPFVQPSTFAKYGWCEADIVTALNDCDVLLPLSYDVKAGGAGDCREHFIHHHGKGNYDLFRELLEKYCPEYHNDAEEFFAGHRIHLCNMFVMRREWFEHYCAWLFDVLDKFLPHLTLHHYDGYQIRMPAYMAERLLNLYVRRLRRENPSVRIKEVPYVFVENTASPPRPLPRLKVDKPVVTIVTAFDARYVPYFAAMLASLLDHVSEERIYDLIVLEDSISECDKRLYAAMARRRSNVSIRYINMAGTFEDVHAVHTHFTKSTFNRLKLPELLPEHPKVAYLDPDTILLRDVAELFDTDISGHYAGAALDYTYKYIIATGMRVPPRFGNTTVLEYLRNYLEIGDEAVDRYFNAGVMLLNLDRIRAEGLTDVFEHLFRARPYYCVDQDILNKAFGGRILHLDPRWNVIAQPMSEMRRLPHERFKEYERSREEPWVVHFAGSHLKPWNNMDVDFAERFWMYCRQTPYYEKVLMGAIGRQGRGTHDGHSAGFASTRASGQHPRWPAAWKIALGDRLYRASPRLWGVCYHVYHKVVG